MNKELIEALEVLEKEKNISKAVMLEAIENSLLTACKNHFGRADNIRVNIDPDTGDFSVIAEKQVVEEVEEPAIQISLAEARMSDPDYQIGDVVQIPVESKSFGRIATQNAKNVILQKIREEERKALYNDWYAMEKDIVPGVVQRYFGRNISINLGKVDAILSESEQVKGEVFRPTERIRVYVLEVKDTPRGPRISVSRSHPDLVKRLFELEVAEVRDGTVEIKAIAREAGSRTKIAVKSNDPNVDPVGACVGLNGTRVNSVVRELRGEKIDVINWDDNAAFLIENALSPAKVIFVMADEEAREAQVIVPDYQLSLAIGKEGQNARLAAKLTGYKIDIKSESQAREMGLFEELGLENQTQEGVYESYDDYQGYGDGYPQDGYYHEDYQEGYTGYQNGYQDQNGYPEGYEGQNGYPEGNQEQSGYPEGYSDQNGYPEGYEGQDGYPEGYQGQNGYPEGYEAQSGYPESYERQNGYPEGNQEQNGYPEGYEGQSGYSEGYEGQSADPDGYRGPNDDQNENQTDYQEGDSDHQDDNVPE